MNSKHTKENMSNSYMYVHVFPFMGLTLTTIQKIKADYGMCGQCLLEIMKAWIDRSTSVSPSEKWKTFAQALVDIKEKRLAEKIVFLH